MAISRPTSTTTTTTGPGSVVVSTIANAYDGDTATSCDVSYFLSGGLLTNAGPFGVTFSGFSPDIPGIINTDRNIVIIAEVTGTMSVSGNYSFYFYADLPWAPGTSLLSGGLPFQTNSAASALVTFITQVPTSYTTLSGISVPIFAKLIRNSGVMSAANFDCLIHEIYITAPEKGGGNDVWENF